MHLLSRSSFPRPTPAVVMGRQGSIIFLTGQAWDHPTISYRVWAEATIPTLVCAVARRAIQSWNSALAASCRSRLRDFRFVPAADAAADVEIQLRGGAERVDGITEIVCGADDAIVRAVVRLHWPTADRPADLGMLATLTVRGIGRALGLENAADPADPMYPAFNGVKLQPSAEDVAALAAVEEWYVARCPYFYPPRGYTIE
jgi:hypothetical protein